MPQAGTDSLLDELHSSHANAQGYPSSLIYPDLQTGHARRQYPANNGEHLQPQPTTDRVAGVRWSRRVPFAERPHATMLLPNMPAARSKDGLHGISEFRASEASSSSPPLLSGERNHNPQMNCSITAS
jgi:hypothetical protein